MFVYILLKLQIGSSFVRLIKDKEKDCQNLHEKDTVVYHERPPKAFQMGVTDMP